MSKRLTVQWKGDVRITQPSAHSQSTCPHFLPTSAQYPRPLNLNHPGLRNQSQPLRRNPNYEDCWAEQKHIPHLYIFILLLTNLNFSWYFPFMQWPPRCLLNNKLELSCRRSSPRKWPFLTTMAMKVFIRCLNLSPNAMDSSTSSLQDPLAFSRSTLLNSIVPQQWQKQTQHRRPFVSQPKVNRFKPLKYCPWYYSPSTLQMHAPSARSRRFL